MTRGHTRGETLFTHSLEFALQLGKLALVVFLDGVDLLSVVTVVVLLAYSRMCVWVCGYVFVHVYGCVCVYMHVIMYHVCVTMYTVYIQHYTCML